MCGGRDLTIEIETVFQICFRKSVRSVCELELLTMSMS